MKRNYSFALMSVPLSILVFFVAILFIQRTGISYKTTLTYGGLKLLPQANVEVADYFPEKKVEAVVLYDPQDIGTQILVENVQDTLNIMRVKYDLFDVHSGGKLELSKYQTAIVAFVSWDDVGPQILALVDWVESGGRVLFAIHPLPSNTFSAIYRKLGIITKGDALVLANGIEYKTDLFVGAKGLSLKAQELTQTSYPVELSGDSIVHLTTSDERKIPLLWEYNFGRGRFVFINSDMFSMKESRGIIGVAYSLLPDAFVYPVINSSVFFIDDFPSPVPEGSTDLIEKEYGMRISDFYTNVWWPDMLAISKKYNIKYTAVMIETYDYNFVAPFDKELDNERHRYFGGQILANGGELGLHGYNHVPLCLSETGVNQTHDYPGWPTTESMQLSVYEWFRFAKSLFPNNVFTTYVPPSNMLCSDSRLWLPAVLPDLKVIASVYINDAEKTSYAQEFTEASDGIIEFPRILSGYELNDISKYEGLNGLNLYFVNTDFVHPDDVLDPERGALEGWAKLRNGYEEYVKWITGSAPGLRTMTAREGAIAVQRYARLAVKTGMDNNGVYGIDLGNFYDEAWLMLRSRTRPLSIEGGTIEPVTSDLYLIKALKPKLTIKFEGETP